MNSFVEVFRYGFGMVAAWGHFMHYTIPHYHTLGWVSGLVFIGLFSYHLWVGRGKPMEPRFVIDISVTPPVVSVKRTFL